MIVRFAPPLADVVLLVLCVLVVASIVLTLLAYARTEQKNAYLRAIQMGVDATLPDSWWGRVVDRQSSPAGTFGTVRVTPRRVDCR